MCGGSLNIEENSTVCECEYCGTKQTVPNVDDEKILKLYERANRLRMSCEFDKAATVYESIIAEKDTDAECYWGLVLCKFGIEYVDDPATGDKIPTCHRSSFDSVMRDSDFEMVMKNADSASKNVYREQAKQIEEIRKGIIEVSGNEQPYDIFICYKETTENGQRTIDSVLAQDVYDALTEKGYRVFFSRISLEDKLGTEYEPYIFAALNSSKIMLAFGTNYEYYNAVWVKNEWSRFIKLMAKDKSKHLIPCYKDIDAYDMPEEFARLQAQDMGKVGAIQDLVRGVDKLTGRAEKVVQATTVVQQVVQSAPVSDGLLERGFMMLEDGDWDKADSLFEEVLNQNPKCASAYMGKLLGCYKMKSLQAFARVIFNEYFSDTGRVRVKLDYDVSEVIETNCNWITRSTRKRIVDAYENVVIYNKLICLKKYDSSRDYFSEYLTLSNEKDDATDVTNKNYQRFLQYATELEKENFNILGIIESYVESELAEAAAEYEQKKDIYSKKKLIDILNGVKKKLDEQCGGNFEEVVKNYQRDISEWEKKCEVLAKWKLEKVEVDKKYEQEKLAVETNNGQIEKKFKEAMSEYMSQVDECNRMIADFENKLASLTGLFKGKQKNEIRVQIATIQAKRDNIHKPVISDYGVRKAMPIKSEYPPRPELSEQPELPVKPELLEEPKLPPRPEMEIPGGLNVDNIIITAIENAGIRVPKNVHSTIVLGSYRGEPIEWLVLDSDGNNKLLLSKMALDSLPYNEKFEKTTWEKCTLRKWLNNEFLNEALSDYMNKIVLTKVMADKNPEFDTDPGNDTQDKVFLLSIDELNKYFDAPHYVRRCYATEYAKTTGIRLYDDCDENDPLYGSCWWWLRSPGTRSSYAAYVNRDGSVSLNGINVSIGNGAVRPALWIDNSNL